MRSSFLRPLAFEYVDVFEKKCQTEQIPAKFKQQPDDYQRRIRRDPHDVDEDQISPRPVLQKQPFDPPKEQSKRTIYTLKQLTEPILSKPFIEDLQTKRQNMIKIQSPRGNSSPFLACCNSSPQQTQICEKCFQSLCLDCDRNFSRIIACTRCLQKLCRNCKQILRIDFPDYKIRNYPISLKKLSNLHFMGCTCPECTAID